MAHVNLVVLSGRLVADPRFRELPSGAPVASFSVAVNRPFRKKDGTWGDAFEGFFDCEVFDALAVSVSKELKKGSPVMLTGTLLQKTYEGNDGNTVKKYEIRVRSIGPALVPVKKDSAAPAAAEPQPA